MAPEKPDFDLYPWINPEFIENQKNFPQEELDKHRGQYVAWSFDAGRIVASGYDREELDRNLKSVGQDPCRVIYDYVDDA